MSLWYRIFGTMIGALALSVNAQICPTTGQTCTVTINPGGNVTSTVEGRSAGQTVCLNTGTYTPMTTASYVDSNSFAIGKSVTICGLGTSPSQTILQGGGASDYAVKFMNYALITSPNNATLTNVQVNDSSAGGSNGGILVYGIGGSIRLSGITLRDVVVQTKPGGTAYGVLLQNADKINLANVDVTSAQSGLFLLNTNQSVVVNSRVTATTAEGANGLAVIGGSGNVVVGNIFGSPKTGSTYSFNAGAVTFYNTSYNRFDNNVVQGFRDDGVDFTALPGMPVPTAQSTDNYVGKNSVIATGAADGRVAGSTIWSNCGSNGTWIFGNDAKGSPECGVCVWLSKSNMLLGNNLHAQNIAGIVVSGGSETLPFCTANSGEYQFKPTSTYIHGNYLYYNKNDQLTIRNSDLTTISANMMAPRNGFGGALRTDCINSYCQSAFSFDANNGSNNTGARIVANINHDNIRGFQSDDGATTGIEFAHNRMIQTNPLSFSRYNLPGSNTSTNWDGGTINTGGNYWTLFGSPNGDPGDKPYGTLGSGNPYLGVYDGLGNTTGRIVDRFPYKSENLGKGYAVNVSEPLANSSFAQGTRRTVRWYAPGCAYVDISLDGSALLVSNFANTGYAVVTIPDTASVGSHSIAVTCKDSGGTEHGSGSSPLFNVTSPGLKLFAPGRDDVFDAGSEIVVAWTMTSAQSVFVDLSTDGGATFPTTFGPFTGTNIARVTLPSNISTAYALLRVRSGFNLDYTDGVFAIRGDTGAGFTNIGSGRQLVMSQLERLEWISPKLSRLVDITAIVGGVQKTVASNLPDRGYFDWIVPEWGTSGAMTLQISYKQTSGTAITSTANGNGLVVFPATSPPTNPPRLFDISTRGMVSTGFNVMIGGFVISGSTPKKVVVRGIGPSLTNYGITGVLLDPTVQLVRQSDNVVIATNDDWGSVSNVSELIATGFAPSHGKESAIYMTLQPGAYTAVVSGVGETSGVGLVEIYEVDQAETPMISISTRGQVLTGFNVMIGGFIIQGNAPKTVLVRAVGPTLAKYGVSGVLTDPMMEIIRISDGAKIAQNDDWQTQAIAADVSAITATGLMPEDPLESTILLTLPPGAYTAVVNGKGGGTGVGIIEVFAR